MILAGVVKEPQIQVKAHNYTMRNFQIASAMIRYNRGPLGERVSPFSMGSAHSSDVFVAAECS